MLKDREFMKSITFEEDPFEDETPDEVQFFDLDGNEVSACDAE